MRPALAVLLLTLTLSGCVGQQLGEKHVAPPAGGPPKLQGAAHPPGFTPPETKGH